MVSIARNNKNISPFSLSLDGMLRNQPLVVLTILSQLMVTKTEEPLSHIRRWVNGRIAIEVVRS